MVYLTVCLTVCLTRCLTDFLAKILAVFVNKMQHSALTMMHSKPCATMLITLQHAMRAQQPKLDACRATRNDARHDSACHALGGAHHDLRHDARHDAAHDACLNARKRGAREAQRRGWP
jgi:hypothetical protein